MKEGMFFCGAALITYKLLDDGVRNMLELETLRHGTKLINYISIRLRGAKISYANSKHGSTYVAWNGEKDDRVGIYCFKDSDYSFMFFDHPFNLHLGQFYPFKSLLPKYHTFLAGYSNFGIGEGMFTHVFGFLSGCLNVLISPTLKFRCTHYEYDTNFLNDRAYGGIACYTGNEDMVKPWRIGMLGSLVAGLNVGVFKRIKSIQEYLHLVWQKLQLLLLEQHTVQK